MTRRGRACDQGLVVQGQPAIQNDILAGVQRIPGGNTIIAYSIEGVLHEVDASGVLLQAWS
jgi:hypothetical protein